MTSPPAPSPEPQVQERGGQPGVSTLANWRQGVRDEFKERSPGLQLGGLSGLLAVAGLAILVFGVFRGL